MAAGAAVKHYVVDSYDSSPALVAEYQLHLPNKAVLESKLKELTEYAEAKAIDDEE